VINYSPNYISEIVDRERVLYLKCWRASSTRQELMNILAKSPIWRARVQRHWEEGLLRREPYSKMSYKTAAKFHNQIRFCNKISICSWSSKEYLSSWKEIA